MKYPAWLQRSVALPRVSTGLRLLVVTVFLAATLGITIVLANDPNWAKWHISYLGEGNAPSAHYFNVSMWIAGLLVFWLSLSFRRDLEKLRSSGKRFLGVKPRIIQAGLALMALCVYLVGLFPRSFGILPHDIFGHVIYFAFLLLCISSPWVLPGLPKWFYWASYAFHGAMMVLFVMYWTDLSDSLYVAEVATFVFFLGWLLLLVRESKRATTRI